MAKAHNDQLRKEDLSDQEWQAVCELFALILHLRKRIDGKAAESRSPSPPEPDNAFRTVKQAGHCRNA